MGLEKGAQVHPRLIIGGTAAESTVVPHAKVLYDAAGLTSKHSSGAHETATTPADTKSVC